MIEFIVPVIVAIITGGLALIGNIISNRSSNDRITNTIERKLEVNQAVTDLKLDNLTQEIRGVKTFAFEVPVIKQRLTVCEDDIKELKAKGV